MVPRLVSKVAVFNAGLRTGGTPKIIARQARGARPEVAPHSNSRGTLHPASRAGSNLHLATALFTLDASQGWVVRTTANVRMSARPRVSTSTVIFTALYFAVRTASGIDLTGSGAGTSARGDGSLSTGRSACAVARRSASGQSPGLIGAAGAAIRTG